MDGEVPVLRSERLPRVRVFTSRWGTHARSSKAEWAKVWGALGSQNGDPMRASLPGILPPHSGDLLQGHGSSWRLLGRAFRMGGWTRGNVYTHGPTKSSSRCCDVILSSPLCGWRN